MKYYSIAFMHDYEDKTVESFLNSNLSDIKMVLYLMQWDMGGESEHCLSEYNEPPWGKDDRVRTFEETIMKPGYPDISDYILSWNNDLGYVSLTRMGE